MERHNRFYDVVIIGGGLHGAAIAADCAGRGLRTLLCDQGDVGGTHNVVSSRLFHCGLQYLQRGDLARVAKSIRERTSLLKRAPHLVHPTTVILPQSPGFTSRLKINTKAWLYKLVAGQHTHLEATNIAGTPWSEPLKVCHEKEAKNLPAICFEDALLNDARLTVENLLLAREHGAVILPHTRLTKAERTSGHWDLLLSDTEQRCDVNVQSQCVINAAGPDAEKVQKDVLGVKSRCSASRYNAGYIVVPGLFDGEQSYLIESKEPHLIAALPYMDSYTLVGPVIFDENGQNPVDTKLGDQQIDRLLALIKQHFKRTVNKDQVLAGFAVRTSAFKETPESAPTPFSQDYVLDFNCSDGRSPAVTLFGACVNMHRSIAEEVVEQLAIYLRDEQVARHDWTEHDPLPGARCKDSSAETLRLRAADCYPWLPFSLLNRLCSEYGERTFQLLGKAATLDDLGKEVLPSLYEKEIQWLHDYEWAVTPEAVLWHRTKLGLTLSHAKIVEFNQWFIQKFRYHPAISELHLHTQMNKEAS